MTIFKTGDVVRIVCAGRSIDGSIVLASSNGKSMMLMFDAILDGHFGQMPVLRDDDGIYRSIVNGVEVEIKGSA